MYVCVFLLAPQTCKFNTHQWSTILQGVGCWWQLDIRRKGKEGIISLTEQQQWGNQCVKWGYRVLAFILSLQIHDLYQRLPEACEGILNHIEQQLKRNKRPVLLKDFIKEESVQHSFMWCVCLCRFTLSAGSMMVHCVWRSSHPLESREKKEQKYMQVNVLVSHTWP